MKIGLAEFHQPEMLRKAMSLEAMRHGDEALATIRNVRVDPAPGAFAAKGMLYFCDIERLRIEHPLMRGDGKPLPDEVELVGDFRVPEPGYYNLRNVKISSNGRLQVIQVPGRTYFVPIDEDMVAVEEEGG
ncbi:MAG: hypothetical protein Q8P88_01880 [Candidatus Jorgensenbacteria bacterium]|nr:hypothetical protein [Candidatus Jorgensenbacteria bacterium]